jgi:hypothetical protein
MLESLSVIIRRCLSAELFIDVLFGIISFRLIKELRTCLLDLERDLSVLF